MNKSEISAELSKYVWFPHFKINIEKGMNIMGNVSGMLATFLPLVIMFGLMYLLLILPEKKRTKKYNAMLSELKVNDEIITRGGVVGKIITLEDEYMVVQSGPDRTRFKMLKTSVSQKINKNEE